MERPIVFSDEMIRAILDGRKTQTRRIMKHFKYCKYQIGMNLWVRETWCVEHRFDTITPSKISEAAIIPIWYRATDDLSGASLIPGKWRSSVHMPRWASRILLEITDVRVERLQKISEADAVAEGAGYWGCDTVEVFQDLWDSINAKRGYSWSSNPWCWCISFKKIGK